MGIQKPAEGKKIQGAIGAIIVFIIGVVLCAIIGNSINGPILRYSDKGFYIFLYVTIPNFLATVVGLPMVGTLGKIFTLVSSLFFILIALKLYCVDVGHEFGDSEDGAENGFRRTIHFVGTFFFLNMVCAMMIDNYLVRRLFIVVAIICIICVITTFVGGVEEATAERARKNEPGFFETLAEGQREQERIEREKREQEEAKKRSVKVWRENGMSVEHLKVSSDGERYYDPNDGEWHRVPK